MSLIREHLFVYFLTLLCSCIATESDTVMQLQAAQLTKWKAVLLRYDTFCALRRDHHGYLLRLVFKAAEDEELLCQFLFLWLMNQLFICFSCNPVS